MVRTKPAEERLAAVVRTAVTECPGVAGRGTRHVLQVGGAGARVRQQALQRPGPAMHYHRGRGPTAEVWTRTRACPGGLGPMRTEFAILARGAQA